MEPNEPVYPEHERGPERPHQYVRYYERPELRDPVLIAAFAGWNDAAEVATSAARFLVRQWAGRRFASVDAEEFYVFTETRPHVQVVGRSQRRINWPANDFYYVHPSDGERDLIVLIGVEPQLKWATFARATLGVARDLGATLLLTLGGLLADVPHTRPPRLTGSATSPQLQTRMRELRVRGSRYEGPTGILGVLGAAAQDAGLPSASIWGNVPHYISATANPRVSLAILRQVARLLDLTLDLDDLARRADAFDEQVSQAIAQNPEVAEYVRRLEQREPGGAINQQEEKPAPPSDLPSSDALIKELEDFLKRQQSDPGKEE